MKTIGMLGGMSWESTISYYQLINTGIKQALGGLHSAKICLYSVDFAQIEQLQHDDNWAATAEILLAAAQAVEKGGADFLIICTNTMHKVADSIQAGLSIPLLHIADATAAQLVTDKIKRVGLLGTRFTMEQDFYKSRLINNYGIEVIVPPVAAREHIHNIIYSELCLGQINSSSKAHYLAIIEQLQQSGAQAIILGCTEIGLLVQQADTTIPLYDTTQLHAAQAVHYALSS